MNNPSENGFVVCKIISDLKHFNNFGCVVPRQYCKVLNGVSHVCYDSPPFTNNDLIFIKDLVKMQGPLLDQWQMHQCKILSSHGKKIVYHCILKIFI